MKANVLDIGLCVVAIGWAVFMGTQYGAAIGVLVGAFYGMSCGKLFYYVIDDIRTKRRRGW